MNMNNVKNATLNNMDFLRQIGNALRLKCSRTSCGHETSNHIEIEKGIYRYCECDPSSNVLVFNLY